MDRSMTRAPRASTTTYTPSCKAPGSRTALHPVLARNGASAPSTLDETLSRSTRSGEVLDGWDLLTRSYGKNTDNEVLHRVLYPNTHGNENQKKKGQIDIYRTKGIKRELIKKTKK